MFDLNAFIEKNDLCYAASDTLFAEIYDCIAAGETLGLVCQGAICGMVPAGLEVIGATGIFSHSLAIGYGTRLSDEHTLTLVAKALSLGVVGELPKGKEEFTATLAAFASRAQVFPESIAQISLNAKQAYPDWLDAYCTSHLMTLHLVEETDYQAYGETLSPMDQMIGKKPNDAACEMLARYGANGGELHCLEQEINGLKLALAVCDWSVAF